MNTHDPTTEPLDDDEREFARVVRALPAGEPPAALDARILKAASDAVASRSRRRFAWLASGGSAIWGIGSAAAAVLAIGLAWHTMNPTPYSLPPSSPVTVRDMEEQESMPVEFSDRSATDAMAAAPPPPPPALPQAQMRAPAPPPAMAAPPPPAPAAPMPFPETGLDEHVAHAGAADNGIEVVGSGQINPIDVGSVESTTLPTSEQIARIDAERRQRAEPVRDAAAKAARASQPAPASSPALGAAARADAAKEEADARVQSDTRRYPESWLLKIRARLKEGDAAGARASLKLFVAKYPRYAIPDDLKPLLKQ